MCDIAGSREFCVTGGYSDTYCLIATVNVAGGDGVHPIVIDRRRQFSVSSNAWLSDIYLGICPTAVDAQGACGYNMANNRQWMGV